jgi:hypothetical protein
MQLTTWHLFLVNQMRTQLAGNILIFVVAINSPSYSQDAESVKQSVLKGIERIEHFPAMTFRGTYEGPAIDVTCTFHVRGDEVWQENSDQLIKRAIGDEKKREMANARLTTKCQLPTILAFDGKNNYDFNPFNLELRIEPGKYKSSSESDMLPKRWIAINGSPNLPFRKLLEGKIPEVKVERLNDGRWKLSQTGVGDNLPEESRKRIGVRERSIIVDPKLDFHITEYETNGAMGHLSGVLEWEKQDGFWFVKHGKHIAEDSVLSEFRIDEISFDEKKCRTRFDDIEDIVPFATRIRTKDANDRLVTEQYKGGVAGEDEHKAIKRALLEHRTPKVQAD